MSMPSIPHTSTPEEPPSPSGGKPGWLLRVLVVLACLAVVASGWGVARLAIGDTQRPLEADDGPESRPPRGGPGSGDAVPEDAEAYLSTSVELVESAPAFHMTFVVYDGVAGSEGSVTTADSLLGASESEEVGRGEAVYRAGAAPEFDHVFTTADDRSVYRYDMGGGRLMMTSGQGLKLLDPPEAADRYLCSRDFGSAKLREVLDTSTDLTLTGLEEVDLEGPGLDSTHSAYRYTGTFTTMLGGFDPGSGRNTLTVVEEASFDLWIDERGYPRRLDYLAPNGVGESYEYHSFS